MRVYLAGPIKGLTYAEAVAWREIATFRVELWGHEVANPMRGKGYLKDAGLIDTSHRSEVMSTAKGIYGRDSFDIQHSDVLFVNLVKAPEVSIGTVMEVQMGKDYGKYVLLCTEPGGIHDHPFVTEASSIVAETIEDGLGILKHLLGKGNGGKER